MIYQHQNNTLRKIDYWRAKLTILEDKQIDEKEESNKKQYI